MSNENTVMVDAPVGRYENFDSASAAAYKNTWKSLSDAFGKTRKEEMLIGIDSALREMYPEMRVSYVLCRWRQLPGHPEANAACCAVRRETIHQDGEVMKMPPIFMLRSYDTIVAAYNCITGEALCSGVYSQTTIKHIGWFANWCADFMKMAYGDCRHIDYYTFKNAIVR